MAVYFSPVGNGFQFFSSTGLPLNGGFLYSYAAGTTTPIATYTSNTGLVANSNPIVLGSDGRVNTGIWLVQGTAYKFVLTDSLGNILPWGPPDNVAGVNDPSALLSGNFTFNGNLTFSGTDVFNGAMSFTNTITVVDSGFTIYDDVDPTKKIKFQASGISPSTTRVYTMQDADQVVAGGPGIGQISFPVTQNPSALPNVLDDYEEGLWTPSIGGSATYTARGGVYTKIGNVVFFTGFLVINVIGTGSTTIISGLPFSTNGISSVVAVGESTGCATAVVSMEGVVTLTSINLWSRTAANAAAAANPIFGNSTSLRFSGSFFTA